MNSSTPASGRWGVTPDLGTSATPALQPTPFGAFVATQSKGATLGWLARANEEIYKNLVKNDPFGQKPAKNRYLGCFPQGGPLV